MKTTKASNGSAALFGIGLFILSIVLSGVSPRVAEALIPDVSSTPTLCTPSTCPTSVPNNAWSVIEPIMAKANANPALITSFAETTGTAAINVRIQENGTTDFFTLSASALSKEIYNTKNDTVAKSQATANFNVIVSPSIGGFIGLTEANIGVELRTFTNTANQREFYFRVNNMTPKLYKDMTKMMGSSKNKFQIGTWYKMNSLLKKIMTPTVATTRAESIRRETEAVKLIFSNVTLEQDFGMDTTTNVPTRHLKFGFTKDGLTNILNGATALTGNQSLSASERREIADVLDTPEFKKFMDATKLEIWISPEDSRIYRIQIGATNVNIPTGTNSPNSVTITFDLAARIKSVNQSFKIDKPAKFVDLQKLIDDATKDARIKGKEAGVKANLSNHRANAELFYSISNNSYQGYCQSSESYGFVKMNQDLAKSGYVAECKTTPQAFIITAKLAPNQYWCVDSTGASVETKTNRRVAGYMTCR